VRLLCREGTLERLVGGIKGEFFAISVERKIKNPAVAVMTEHAREAFHTVRDIR
jgi:hypothetical protein